MASDIVTGSNTTYLSIIGGNLKQKVTEDTDGAKLRKYEKKDGSEGEKWELTHRNVSGKLVSFGFDKKDFGVTMLEIVIVDENGVRTQIGTPDNSRYANDFMEKLPNIDLNEEIVFNTYDFEATNTNTGKKSRKTGVSIVQNDEKIQTAFYDFEAKKPINGLPQPEGDTEEYETDDWKMYYMIKKKFLVKFTKTILANHVAIQPVQAEEVKAEPKSVESGDQDDLPF